MMAGQEPAMSTQLKELTHYICWKAEDTSTLGATKLNKALWFADTLAYRLSGRSITGAVYVKRQFGPVPRQILPVLRELEAEGAVHIRMSQHFNRMKRDFIALKPANPAVFSEQERAVIDDVIAWVCDQHTATSISDLSHDAIWEAAEEGEEIPYFAVLAAAPGAVTAADMEWANKIIA
jgi:hypothetical protein